MLKKLILTTMLVGVCCVVSAQVTIKGRVLNSETGEPVVGANIRVDHSLQGGTTNAKGEFIIKGLPDGKQTLQVSHLNYEPQRYSTSKSVNDVVIRMTESHNNLNQVVVTGTGTHRRMVDSPIPVNVLTAKDIKEANVTNLEEALTKLTSNFSFSTSGMGTEMVLNGLNSDYILVLVNGRKLIGDDALMRINMANVKRIEILNGSASALYGSDAIGGVINIITDDSKNKIDASSTTKVSDHGRFSEAVNLDLNVGKLSSYTSYQRQQSDGWKLHPMTETVNKKGEVKLDPTDKQAFTGYHSNTVNQSFSYSLNHKTTLYAQGSYYNFLNDRPVTEYKYNMYHENYTYGFGMKYIVNKKAYIDADFYSDNFTSRYDSVSKPGEASRGKDTRKKVHYYNGSLKGIFKLGQAQKFSVGMEYVKETLMSATDDLDGENMYTMALFLQDEIRLWKNFQAVVGLRYIYNEFFKNYATPNVALSYKWGDLNFRASYASGFRTPTLSQLYATDVAKTTDIVTIPNFNLKSEKSDYFMLNAEYVHNRISFSVSGYINKIRDMINYRGIDPAIAEQLGYGKHNEAQQRDNISRAEVKGVKAVLNVYAGAGFSVGGSYHFMDTEDKTTQEPIDKSVKNVWTANARWGHRWGLYHLNVNLNGRIQEGRYSKTYYYDPAPGFSQWDLNTRHSFNLKSVVLEPGFGVENLFDKVDDRPWNSNYSTLNPGRSFYVSLSVRFN